MTKIKYLADANSNLLMHINFIEFKNANKHNTISCTSRNLKLPLYSTNRTGKSVKFQGAKLWNALSFSLKQQSRRKFVKEFKSDAIANYLP